MAAWYEKSSMQTQHGLTPWWFPTNNTLNSTLICWDLEFFYFYDREQCTKITHRVPWKKKYSRSHMKNLKMGMTRLISFMFISVQSILSVCAKLQISTSYCTWRTLNQAFKLFVMSQIMFIDPTPLNKIFHEQNLHWALKLKTALYVIYHTQTSFY